MTLLYPPIFNIESRRYPWSEKMVLGLAPTLFLDERDLVVVTGEYNNWGNQSYPGADDNDFAAANASTRPATGSFIAGYAAPYFSGAQVTGLLKYMQDVSGNIPTIITTLSYSVFIVARCNELSGTNSITYANPALFGDSGQFLGLFSSKTNGVSSNATGIKFYNWDVNEKATPPIAIVTSSNYIIEGHFISGSKSECRVNNWVTQSANVINALGTAGGALRVGLTATQANQFQGAIGAVLVFNRPLTAGQKKGVRTYLANKYAIQLYDDGDDVPRTPPQYFGNGLTGWWNGGSGINGSPIDAWQSSGSYQPMFFSRDGTVRPSQATWSGFIVPDFDGTNDSFTSTNTAVYGSSTAIPFSSASGTGQWEILIAGTADTISGSVPASPHLEAALFSEGNGGHGITFTTSGARAFTNNGSTIVTPYTSGTLVAGDRFLIHAYYDGAKVTCRFNDATTVSASIAGNLASTTQPMFLGRNYNGTIYYDGKIFECMVFSRSLNTTERTWVRTYLGTKWGIYT